MFLWFAVLAPVLVASVFKSPTVDYRMVALGALLPLLELLSTGPGLMHTLLAPVSVLIVVMLATVQKTELRRRLLGIPIGMFLHITLDATWANNKLFWWPLFGVSRAGESFPESSAPALLLLKELIAVGVAVWAAQRYRLHEPQNLQRLIKQGHIAL